MIYRIRDTWLGVGGISLLMALVLLSDNVYQQPINRLVLIKLLFDLSTIVMPWHLNPAIIGGIALFHGYVSTDSTDFWPRIAGTLLPLPC